MCHFLLFTTDDDDDDGVGFCLLLDDWDVFNKFLFMPKYTPLLFLKRRSFACTIAS